jgi:Flp pilus assembly protein CpaB
MSQPQFPQPPYGSPSGSPSGVPGYGVPGAPINFGGPPSSAEVSAATAKNATKGRKGRGKDKKDEAAPTPRTARKFVIMGAASLIVAGLAFVFLNDPKPTTYVVRAGNNIGALATVTQDQLKAIQIDDKEIESGAVTGKTADKAIKSAMSIIGDRPTQIPIFAGAQIHPEMFSKSQIKLDNGLAADERLISIKANVSDAVGGSIAPGDHVDVTAVSTSGDPVANVIAYDVPVVGVTASDQQINQAAGTQTGEDKDKKPSDLLPGAPIPGTYIIKIKAPQQPLFSAVSQGYQLYLGYRPANAESSQAEAVNGMCAVTHGVDPTTNQLPGGACAPQN